MKSYWKQVGIIAVVFFIPSALIISGFFYFTIGIFQERIYQLDGQVSSIVETLLLNDNEQSQPGTVIESEMFVSQVSLFEDDIWKEIDGLESKYDELDSQEWQHYESLLHALDGLEEDTYDLVIADILPPMYTLLIVVFMLSGLAAYVVLRPLQRSLDQQKRFIADASHEIKTPLALMQSELDLFVKEYTDLAPNKKQTMNLIENLQVDTKRLSVLTTKLLKLARMETPQKKSEALCTEKDLHDLLKRLTQRFNKANQNHSIVFQVNSLEKNIQVDCVRLEQIIEILLENACTHTPEGTEIFLDTKLQKKTVVIRVKDNGPGIALQHTKHLFDRFYRIDSSRHTEGNGLGLSIAKRLAELDGGNLGVLSDTKGTTFLVSYAIAV